MDEQAEDLRGHVCRILGCAKLPKDNLTREQRKALKELREMDALILPADKGNVTVVMAEEDYDTKMRELLETTTYWRLERDPMATREEKEDLSVSVRTTG